MDTEADQKFGYWGEDWFGWISGDSHERRAGNQWKVWWQYPQNEHSDQQCSSS